MIELKTVVPGQLTVTAQPMPEDLDPLEKQGYKTLISNRPDNEQEGQPSTEQMRAAAEEHNLTYIHIPVTLDSISRADIDAFYKALQSTESPTIAHCGSGRRSYLLWAAGEVLYHGRAVDELVGQAARIGFDVNELQQIIEKN